MFVLLVACTFVLSSLLLGPDSLILLIVVRVADAPPKGVIDS
jgi:hypothetical protein